MEVSQLRYLVAASETSSFAKAAQRCFTSRQNLAHSIQVLEKELGVKLFMRLGNSMVLTTEGEEVVSKARAIVAAVDELSIAFIPAPTTNLGEPLKVLFGTSIIACSPIDIIRTFDCYPGPVLHISEHGCDTCYRRVADGRADMAIIACMMRSFPECESAVLRNALFYALVSTSSPLAKLDRVEVRDLAGHKLLLLSDPAFQYGPLLQEWESCGFKRDGIDIIASTSTMARMVKRHDAVAIVDAQFCQAAPQGTIAIPFADPQMRWYMYALYRKNSEKRESVLALLKYVKSTFSGATDSA